MAKKVVVQETKKALSGKYVLEAQKREMFGRKIKTLRRDGILPANVYGKKMESLAIQLKTSDFLKVFSEAGETGLVTLNVDGSSYPVLVHNLQVDPVLDKPLHADFLQVNLKEKVTATVSVEFVGESPAEKAQEGIVVPQVREVEVEALPADLPEQITVDVSTLEKVDDAIKISDIKVDREKVEIKEDPERIVVSVAPLAKEEVVEEAPQKGQKVKLQQKVKFQLRVKKPPQNSHKARKKKSNCCRLLIWHVANIPNQLLKFMKKLFPQGLKRYVKKSWFTFSND